jgi:hypothetical protein
VLPFVVDDLVSGEVNLHISLYGFSSSAGAIDHRAVIVSLNGTPIGETIVERIPMARSVVPRRLRALLNDGENALEVRGELPVGVSCQLVLRRLLRPFDYNQGVPRRSTMTLVFPASGQRTITVDGFTERRHRGVQRHATSRSRFCSPRPR